MKSRVILWLSSGLILLLTIVTVARLYVLRFEVGDVYPPYSSLRADPLGTKVLFASLEALPDRQVTRAYRDVPPTIRGSSRTILLLGVPPELDVSANDMRQLKELAAAGDRIVIALLPVQKAPEKKAPAKASPSPSPSPDPAEELREETTGLSSAMAGNFGCGFAYFKKKDAKKLAHAASEEFESPVVWNSLLHFDKPSAEWRKLYEIDGRPVAVERRYGRGSLVLLADAYLFSNEALREDLSPRFIAHLLGAPGSIVFDETLHGLHENPGVAGLMRKYRLEPFFIFALVLAGLFAWQNMCPLVPLMADSKTPREQEIAGRDELSGRINLLRRSVPPATLIAQCLRLWQSSAGRRLARKPALLAEIEAQAAASSDPLTTYRSITATLEADRHPPVS